MSIVRFAISLFLSIFLLKDASFAGVYEYADSKGNIHLTSDSLQIPTQHKAVTIKEDSIQLSKKQFTLLEYILKEEKEVSDANMDKIRTFLDRYSEFMKQTMDDPEQLAMLKDSRLSTPEGACELYRSALRSGNVQDLRASVASSYWVKSVEYISKLGKKKMAEWERDTFAEAKIEKIDENEHSASLRLIRTEGRKRITYKIDLVNLFGNWKICQM
jgi:hypothetical protein